MLGLSVELGILSKLDSRNIVTQQLYRIVNSRSEIEILEKIPQPYCLLSGEATSNILYFYSRKRYAVLFLTAPR